MLSGLGDLYPTTCSEAQWGVLRPAWVYSQRPRLVQPSGCRFGRANFAAAMKNTVLQDQPNKNSRGCDRVIDTPDKCQNWCQPEECQRQREESLVVSRCIEIT